MSKAKNVLKNTVREKGIIAVSVIILILLFDQWLKIGVKTSMTLHESIVLVPDWAQLFFTENKGMAFGMEFVGTYLLCGFRIVAVSFLLMAYNVFSSGWFTALNDGKTSAVLSFCRTVLFMLVPVLVLPRLFGVDGVWLSLSVGEGLSLLMTLYYFVEYRKVWTPERGTAGETELQ